jgi:hypothetical protein
MMGAMSSAATGSAHPSQCCVQPDARERDSRQVGTEGRLGCVGLQSAALEREGHPTLGAGQHGHPDYRQHENDEADPARLGGFALPECRHAVHRDIEGKREEGRPDDPVRDALHPLPEFGVEVGPEPPLGCHARRHFDPAVHPEAQEGNAPLTKPAAMDTTASTVL